MKAALTDASNLGEGQGGRGPGPAKRRGPHLLYSLQVGTQGQRLLLTARRQFRIAAPHQESLGVGGALAVSDEDDHGSRRRPHSAQVMNSPAGRVLKRLRSSGESAIRQPSQRPSSTWAAPEIPTRLFSPS
jgi:hypothetical protein